MSVLALLAVAALGIQDPAGKVFTIGETDPDKVRLQYFVPEERLPEPKKTPKLFEAGEQKVPLEFQYLIGAYGRIDPEKDPTMRLKFRVFSQDRSTHENVAPLAARLLLQAWDINIRKLKNDHPLPFNDGIIDVYLCWGGTPGGEHAFEVAEDKVNNRQTRVSSIYIYDVPSFKDPVDMARELLHEYGHATLNAIGGYKTPEDLANGQLGEKLFMTYLLEAYAAKRIESVDMMRAELPMVASWVKKNVDPLVQVVAEKGPQRGMLEGIGQGAMDAANGLILYMNALLPPNVFAQSLKNMGGSSNAIDYLRAVKDALAVRPATALNIPDKWKNIAIWVPLADNWRLQNGTIVRREGDWALIRGGLTGVTSIVNPSHGG